MLSHRPFTVDSIMLRRKMLIRLCMGRLFTYPELCAATNELKLLRNKIKQKLARVAKPADLTSITSLQYKMATTDKVSKADVSLKALVNRQPQ